jgi:CheY-like chemotaxis protein
MGKKILLVDDSEVVRDMTKAQLEDAGYEVVVAKDGQEGLDLARKVAPDVILLDLMLPRLDGHKVCRLLKFDKLYEHIPVIIMSAKESEADKKIAEQAGANGYIVKPFELELFNQTVQKLTEK